MQLPFTLEQVQTFLMIFIRTGAILFTVPIFGSNELPNMAKIGLVLTVAWIVYPSVPIPGELASMTLLNLIPAIMAEILIGISIGFIARLFFEGIQLGGQLIGFQMGFGIVNVMDPVTGANFSVIAQVQNLLATLLFIGLGMHHLFFKGIVSSFEMIPLFHCYVSNSLLEWIMQMSSSMFVIAIKIAAPVMAALLFTSLVLGMLAKTVPRMHIFIVAFPLKIAVGLFAVGLSLPMFALVLKRDFANLDGYIMTILKLGSL